MIPESIRWYLIIFLFCCYFILNLYNWWSIKRTHWIVDKIKNFAGKLALFSFSFLLVSSLLYQFTNYKSINRDKWMVQISQRVSVSVHFAFNAMTTGLLTKEQTYTADLLNSFVVNGWYSPAWFLIGFVLVLAPFSTAAWLLSVIDSNLGAMIRMRMSSRKTKIIFYSPSDRSILMADCIEKTYHTVRRGQKPLLVFCRSAFSQEKASLEKRAEIRRMRGVTVAFTERDYVYKDKENVLILCANNLEEINEFIPPQYCFPENIKKIILLSNEDVDEINLVAAAVSGRSDSKDSIIGNASGKNNRKISMKNHRDNKTAPIILPYSMWETDCEIAYKELTSDNNIISCNGFIVGEGNILPIALKVMRKKYADCSEEDAEQKYSRRGRTAHIVAFPLQKEVYYRVKPDVGVTKGNFRDVEVKVVEPIYSEQNSPFDLICEYIEKSHPTVHKWLMLVSENSRENIRRKRLFCSKYKDRLGKKSLRIVVYCSNRLEILREREWDYTNTINNIIYIGNDETAIKWIYNNKIKALLLNHQQQAENENGVLGERF